MTKKLTSREKFLRALKRHGYDAEKSHQYWSDMSKKLEAQKKEYEKQGILRKEDAPVNNAGDGQVAGIGVGAQGEPGIKKMTKKKIVPFKIFARTQKQ